MSLYPIVSKDRLIKEYVGNSIKDVQSPSAVIDLAKVKRNCRLMLEASEQLGFGWRAHIKTHKVDTFTNSQLVLELFTNIYVRLLSLQSYKWVIRDRQISLSRRSLKQRRYCLFCSNFRNLDEMSVYVTRSPNLS